MRPRSIPRLLPARSTPRVVLVAVGIVLVAASGTGFGASDPVDRTVSANVVTTISLVAPDKLDDSPPLCTKALAPLDTDACTAAAYTAGAEPVLSLGSLSGTDVEAARGTWHVTTSNQTGYTLQVANTAASGAVMRSKANAIADMPAKHASAADVVGSTAFGIAAGDPAKNAHAAVAYAASPWVTADGGQGALFRGVPIDGVVVAKRTTPQFEDPVGITFAASSSARKMPAAGDYSGSLMVTASTI